MGKRLFFAIEIPQQTKDSLQKVIKSTVESTLSPQQQAQLDWRFSLLHITLIFLGEVSDIEEKRYRSALESFEFAQFQLAPSSFTRSIDPKTNKTRSLRLSFDDDHIAQLRSQLQKAGIPMDSDPVRYSSGHVTLTYTSSPDETMIDTLLKKLNENLSQIDAWLVEDFVLYRSSHGNYHIENVFKLSSK